MDMRLLVLIVLVATMHLMVIGGSIAARLAKAAWPSETMSSSSKLATLLVIGIILRALQRILGPARRRSTHWLIQYGAMAAFYLPIPLGTYALGIICSSSDMNKSIVLLWGLVLSVLVMRHTESTTSYRLSDTLQHGWRHAQLVIYPMYWIYTVLTTYMNMQQLLKCLVFYMCTLVLVLLLPIFVKLPQQVIPSSRQSENFATYMLEARSGGDFFGHGEINLENCIYPFEWSRTHESWIKIKDVLLSDSVDRDICLSYTFFNMIKRRFYGFDCAEEDDQRVRTFVLGLLAEENGRFTNRAFKVVEMEGSADNEQWDVMAHGVHEGEFAGLLRKLLHYLCYPEPPIYRGRRTRVGGDESWMIEVFIYPLREGDPPHVFRTTHRRSTVSAALQDAARLAAARLCDIHTAVVRGTPFRYYPLRTEGARYNGTRMTELEDSPTLTHQVDLTRSMGTAHVVAQEEITALRERLLARHSEVESLREQLAKCEQALAEAEAKAEAARAPPQPTPAPAAAPAPSSPGSGWLRTRLTARKSVRPPGPQSTLRQETARRRRSRSRSDTDPSEFSGSRSRSQGVDYSPSSPSVGAMEE